MKTSRFLKVALFGVLAASGTMARAAIVDFFDASQSFSLYQSGPTSDTALTEGYLFTYTRDKFWSASPGGPPTGRFLSLDWPVGLQAQAVTAGPSPGPAQFTIRRLDGTVFDMPEFTFKLLANTAGAGGTVEIMPKLNGEDAFGDPVTFDATGIAGNFFTYNTTTPAFLGNTSTLVGFDTYQISLYVDFALTDVKLNGNVPEPCSAALVMGGLATLLGTRRRRSCGQAA
ncbi:MAG: hypothetical protein RL088_3317 [Verrucomicrobiota bacterium]|jgi:hypothetical protein